MQALNPIPTLPEELKQAALDGTLVIFVGAGASRLLGCPSWDGLADLVLESLAKVEIITYGDVERLKYLEARKKLSIAHQIASENGQRIDYEAGMPPLISVLISSGVREGRGNAGRVVISFH